MAVSREPARGVQRLRGAVEDQHRVPAAADEGRTAPMICRDDQRHPFQQGSAGRGAGRDRRARVSRPSSASGTSSATTRTRTPAWTPVMSRAAEVIRGNHDKAVAGFLNLDWFNPAARAAALWTRGRRSAPTPWKRIRAAADRARGRRGRGTILLCHGTPVRRGCLPHGRELDGRELPHPGIGASGGHVSASSGHTHIADRDRAKEGRGASPGRGMERNVRPGPRRRST